MVKLHSSFYWISYISFQSYILQDKLNSFQKKFLWDEVYQFSKKFLWDRVEVWNYLGHTPLCCHCSVATWLEAKFYLMHNYWLIYFWQLFKIFPIRKYLFSRMAKNLCKLLFYLQPGHPSRKCFYEDCHNGCSNEDVLLLLLLYNQLCQSKRYKLGVFICKKGHFWALVTGLPRLDFPRYSWYPDVQISTFYLCILRSEDVPLSNLSFIIIINF